MQRDESTVVDTDGNRVDGHSFESGYSLHDVAEAHVRRYVEHIGLRPEAWGINRREDKHVLGDDKMDLKVYDGTELSALLEIKSKTSLDWFGTINRDHFCKYLKQAHAHDVPALVFMGLADDEGETAIVRSVFIEIEPWAEYTRVCNDEYEYYTADDAETFLAEQVGKHPLVEREWRAYDGKRVVTLDVSDGLLWGEFASRLCS